VINDIVLASDSIFAEHDRLGQVDTRHDDPVITIDMSIFVPG
jgi:hypothetical protein